MADNISPISHNDNTPEKLEKIKKRTFIFIISLGIFILIIALLLGGWAWHKHKLHQAQEFYSSQYFKALYILDNPKPSIIDQQQARQQLSEIAQKAPDGIKTYAQMNLADDAARRGKIKEAVHWWEMVQNNDHAEKGIRELSRFLILNNQMNSLPADQLRQGYQKIIDEGSFYSSLAREQIIALDIPLIKDPQKRKEIHRQIDKILSSSETDEKLRQRTLLTLQILKDEESTAE